MSSTIAETMPPPDNIGAEPNDSVEFTGPVPVVGVLLLGILAMPFLPMLVLAHRVEAAPMALVWVSAGILLAWRLSRGRRIVIDGHGFENGTGPRGSRRIEWADVVDLHRESEGVVIALVRSRADGGAVREEVIHTGVRDVVADLGASEPGKIETALFTRYRQSQASAASHGDPRAANDDDAGGDAWSNELQRRWLLGWCGVGLVLAGLLLVGLSVGTLIPWAAGDTPLNYSFFIVAIVSFISPVMLVPGFLPRMPYISATRRVRPPNGALGPLAIPAVYLGIKAGEKAAFVPAAITPLGVLCILLGLYLWARSR